MRRFPAEWEPQSLIQFTFPHRQTDWAADLDRVSHCFAQIIQTVCSFQTALVVCDDKKKIASLLRKCSGERLILTELPSNDTWARDHGGITVLEDGQPLILDFEFNGWGGKFPYVLDNQITQRLYLQGVFKNAGYEKMSWILEGGSIETDGSGTLLTTSSCLLSQGRNPQFSKQQIEVMLKQALGLERILWLDHGHVSGDDTDGHIDTLARFCDPDTIAYVQGKVDDQLQHAQLLKMEEELQQFRSWCGRPYRLVSLPVPSAIYGKDGRPLPATYANFLIINGAVLVPQYGVEQDGSALEILGSCFPGREIIGLDCRPLIEQNGSLHCITMQYPREVMV